MKPLRKRNISLQAFIVCCIICLIIGSAGGHFITSGLSRPTPAHINDETLNQIVKTIHNNWYDTSNKKISLSERIIKGLVNELGDEHTSYLGPQEKKDFYDSIDGDFVGIGVEFMKRDEGAFVTRVFHQSPASKAGIKPGDLIIQADGVSLKEQTADKIKNLIRGKENTTVVLTVKRGSQTLNLKVTRKALDTDVFYEVKKINNIAYGYLNITTIGSNTDKEVKKVLQIFKASQCHQLIIDLRNNGGGYVDAAKNILDLFNKKGQLLFSLKNKDNKETKYIDITEEEYSFNKGYILVNGNTASAAELIASQLQEIKGYQLIGEKTYGKGTAQTQVTLPDGGVLKYTYAKWYTAKGKSIDKEGIKPDIEMKSNSISKLEISSFKGTFTYDQVNDHIKSMEIMLEGLGYQPKRTDGYFSKEASEALKKFQTDYHLQSTGTYTNEVQNYLLSAYALYLSDQSKDPVYLKASKLVEENNG